MAEFRSQYKKLGFYVKGEQKKFQDGRYVTKDKEEIKVLSKLSDVERVSKEGEADTNGEKDPDN